MAAVFRHRNALCLATARYSPFHHRISAFSTKPSSSARRDGDELDSLLSKPSWSVRSLLPQSSDGAKEEREVSPEQLSHLLRLSALPQPASEAEQNEMLETLQSQIHFVREIQRVDTAGVAPLVALRDESPESIAENTIGLEDLKEAFAQEEPVGRNGRIRRRRMQKQKDTAAEAWNPLEMASKTAGRYFVVQKTKKEKGATPE